MATQQSNISVLSSFQGFSHLLLNYSGLSLIIISVTFFCLEGKTQEKH
jgi:hypothetical protein